jgi:bifunctional DNA-binding transcriptional regulator/antitoxin component of YhaV-PrlF toxin-antitoxin module
MGVVDTSRIQANFRITLTDKVREKLGKIEVGDIIAFYETKEGILIKKL